jgi:tetratricopeptide (TPR) repeat protein
VPDSAETTTIAVLRGETVAGASVPGAIVEPLAAGTRVGRYVVVERIGRGGMGLVYSARDPDLDRVIALKVLRTDTREPAAAVQQRMLREARALARLSHPNIVRIFDVGVVDESTGPRVWLAMELVDGGTLSEWLARSRRDVAAILAVFVAAGDALAAAHAAGIVHRDFKPGNVLVGKDGAPRVVDFGLALAHGESVDDTSTLGPGSSMANADLRVTTTGMIVGTPAYMAPEQHLGSGADALSDQFAFAVALWEALYGARPFAGERREDLARTVVGCVLPKPPAASEVPPHVHAALVHALQRESAQRFRDMGAFVRALAPRRRSAARTLLASAGIVIGLGGLAAWLDDREPACAGGEAHMAGVWDEPRSEAVAAAFLASDRKHATDSWARVRERLDAHRDAWVAMHREVCESSHADAATGAEDGRQIERALDLRMACLERKRDELRALADVLQSADGDVVDRALGSALRLSPIDRCADADALVDGVLPPDPAIVGEVVRMRAALADAKALSDAGRYERAHAIIGEVEPAARALGYAPLHAEALHRLGVVEVALGRPEDGARAHEDAALAAQANRHDELDVDAATALVYVLGFTLARRDEALAWGEHASAVLERIGDDPVRRAVLLGHLGLVYERAGDYPAAVEHDERALATWHDLAGEDLPDAARVKNSLGNVVFRQGDVARARELWTSAHATFVATLGADHPDIALPLNNLATSDLHLGNDEEAERRLLEVVAIWERALGPDHLRLATPLNNLAVIERDREDYAAADALERRTLRIREKALGPDHTDVAMSLGGLAYSAWKQGRLADAEAEFRRAIAVRERAQGADHPELASSLSNLALVLSDQGKHDEAIATAERSMTIRERALGVHNVEVANSLHALAVALKAADRRADAVPVVERALRLRETAEHIDVTEVAELRVELAELLTFVQLDPTRAAALMQQARTEYESLGATDEVAAIDTTVRAWRSHALPELP